MPTCQSTEVAAFVNVLGSNPSLKLLTVFSCQTPMQYHFTLPCLLSREEKKKKNTLKKFKLLFQFAQTLNLILPIEAAPK
jgi:hypothetical protein